MADTHTYTFLHYTWNNVILVSTRVYNGFAVNGKLCAPTTDG